MHASSVTLKADSGFTLVELVIVIVILGILSVIAAPKFINLKSDAHRSVLNGVRGAISSGNVLAYSKAVLQGQEGKVSALVDLGAGVGVAQLRYGHIPSSLNNIVRANKSAEMSDSAAVFNSITQVLALDAEHLKERSAQVTHEWGIFTNGSDNCVNFVPKGLSVDSQCFLQYTGINALGGKVKVELIDSGC